MQLRVSLIRYIYTKLLILDKSNLQRVRQITASQPELAYPLPPATSQPARHRVGGLNGHHGLVREAWREPPVELCGALVVLFRVA